MLTEQVKICFKFDTLHSDDNGRVLTLSEYKRADDEDGDGGELGGNWKYFTALNLSLCR